MAQAKHQLGSGQMDTKLVVKHCCNIRVFPKVFFHVKWHQKREQKITLVAIPQLARHEICLLSIGYRQNGQWILRCFKLLDFSGFVGTITL